MSSNILAVIKIFDIFFIKIKKTIETGIAVLAMTLVSCGETVSAEQLDAQATEIMDMSTEVEGMDKAIEEIDAATKDLDSELEGL
jgi:hypothetical protein